MRCLNRIIDSTAGMQIQVSSSFGRRRTKRVELEELKVMYETNMMYWNDETLCLSTNNFDNQYFKAIVDMGESAVPMIYSTILESPNPIVRALDFIYPDYLQYEGYVTLDEVCQAWITILQILGKV